MNQLTIDMAIICSKLVTGDPFVYIPNFTPAIYWLSQLHEEMVKEGQITKFRDLGSTEKLKFWTLVCLSIPEKKKWIRIMSCYAVYMHLIIIEKQTE